MKHRRPKHFTARQQKGSQNPHKQSGGNGKRTPAKVRQDSRNAKGA